MLKKKGRRGKKGGCPRCILCYIFFPVGTSLSAPKRSWTSVLNAAGMRTEPERRCLPEMRVVGLLRAANGGTRGSDPL